MNWKPIETAPRDATHILICQAFDADGAKMTDQDHGLFTTRAAWWGEADGTGEWIVYNSQVCEQPAFFEPTHWMEIPELDI